MYCRHARANYPSLRRDWDQMCVHWRQVRFVIRKGNRWAGYLHSNWEAGTVLVLSTFSSSVIQHLLSTSQLEATMALLRVLVHSFIWGIASSFFTISSRSLQYFAPMRNVPSFLGVKTISAAHFIRISYLSFWDSVYSVETFPHSPLFRPAWYDDGCTDCFLLSKSGIRCLATLIRLR